jgi:hypothetical protein
MGLLRCMSRRLAQSGPKLRWDEMSTVEVQERTFNVSITSDG